jgi:hypothetical protein
MEDGSLKAIGQNAEKVAKSTDKATKAADKYSKKQKGVAGISSNSTKNFSKMTTGITGGLVPAYATLAANVFALTAAFGVLSRNDAIAKLQEGLEFTGRAAGRNLTLVSKKLQEITDNAISAEQAMRTTAVGVSAGFSQEQMEGLAKVAKGAAMALGRDLGDAMDRLTRGAAKLEPEILDELGIMVRLDDAVRDYADSVRKSHTELTQFERRMAFTNAIIADGTAKFSALSEALDPSAYSQLSATFSDLTKTFINGINSFFGPMLRFFAETPIAVGALAAAFGASLTGQIMGGLEGMAEKSAEASKATKDMVGESLKGVSAHEKLGKAFNKVADGVNREKVSLDKMMKSLNMTINMTSKDTAKLKIAKKVRNQLTKEIQLQAIAEAKGTHGKALATMQTHGLTAAAKVQAQAFRELATAHTIATTTTTGFATAGVYARSVTATLAMTVRFLGAAFLTIMPYIAGIMMAVSLLSPLYNKFIKDNSNLGKAIKDNEKRIKEFDKVAAQYSKTIPHASKATDAWLTTLKPLAGVLTEAATALDNAFSSANADRIVKMAEASKRLVSAQESLEKGSPNPKGLVAKKLAVGAAAGKKDEAGQFDEKTLERLRQDAVNVTSSVLTTFENMKENLTSKLSAEIKLDGKSEESLKRIEIIKKRIGGTTALLDTAISDVDAAFNKFLMGDMTEEAFVALSKSIKSSSNSANSALNAFTSFGETIKKARELVGDPTKTWGVYSKEIDNVTEAINKLNAQGKNAPNEQQKKDLEAAYGIGPDSKRNIESVAAALKDINERSKQNSLDAALLSEAEALGINKVATATEAVRVAKEKANILSKELNEVVVGDTEKQLEVQLKLNAARAEEYKAIQAKYNLLASNARDSGMGETFAAGLEGAGKVKAAEAGGNEDEIAAAKGEALKASFSGLAKDMAALGPEGELMASTIEGALNMQTAFTTAFQAMSVEGASTADKIAAGLGAAMAVVNSLSQVQKAASEAKLRGIDNEIAAERARDGMTAASVQKIKALEAKKDAEKKKAFEQEKKMKKAQTVMATAMAVMQAFALGGPIVGAIMSAFIIALGAKQLSMIDSQTYNGGGGSGGGASSVSVGERNNSVDLAKGNNAGGEIAYARGEQGIGTGMTDYTPTPRASGGYVVGEQGPELFLPQVPGQIVPSDELNTGSTNVNFSIQAVDAQGVEDLLLEQRPNIIGMIREAANASGEFFLEDIDDGYTG